MSASAGTTAGELSDEREWIERARSGDATAYRHLVERYRDRAYGLALRTIGSRDDAEEAAQDAFMRAWRSLPRFRGDSKFSTWLYRIVVRCALDRSIALRARRARETGLDAAAGVEARDTGSVPGEGSAPSTRTLERLLAELSEVQRVVVMLYYYEDRSVEEVARTLGIPEGTVKTHLHRARASLRSGWQRERGAGER